MPRFIGSFQKTDLPYSSQLEESLNLRKHNNLLVDSDCLIATNKQHTLYLWDNIYNAPDWKKEYGYTGNSLAYLVLEHFLNTGIEGIRKFDGDFSFIISNDDETILCRDRHGGSCQIFYNKSFFSARLSDLCRLEASKPTPNYNSLAGFLRFGYISAPQTSLEGVNKIPAGYYLIKNKEQTTLKQLFNSEDFFKSTGTLDISFEEATAEYEKLHKQAIKRRILGKKSVGLLLSGGYDSGGNIHALRNIYNGKVYSYSIGFKDNPWSELPLAQVLSKEYNTEHYEYEIDGSEIDSLPEIVDYLGDPFQEGGLMVNYCVMKLIGDDKPEIILGGDGNDQHFGTAATEVALNYVLKKAGLRPFQKLIDSLGGANFMNNDDKLFKINFYNNKILNVHHGDLFGFHHKQLRKIFNSGIEQQKLTQPKFSTYNDAYYYRNYNADILHVINEVILFKASGMAGMFSNKLTYPYMDTDIYHFLKQLPRELKCSGTVKELLKGNGESKLLHKNYLSQKLPEQITQRKKQGGFAPLPIFFKDRKRREKIINLILDSGISRELFNRKFMEKYIANFNKSFEKKPNWFWHQQIMSFRMLNLIVLVVWWEIMIEQNNVKKLNDL